MPAHQAGFPRGQHLGQQKRECREYRKDVSGQFGARNAEEDEDERRPDQQKAVGLEPRGVGTPATLEDLRQERGPGQQTRYQQRKEVVPGPAAMMLGGQEAVEMLVDEIEVGPFRIPVRHERVPGHRQNREDRQAGVPLQARPRAPIPTDRAVEDQYCAG